MEGGVNAALRSRQIHGVVFASRNKHYYTNVSIAFRTFRFMFPRPDIANPYRVNAPTISI